MKNRNDNQKPNGKPLKNWVIGLGIFCAILLAANIWTLTAYAPSKDNKNESTDQYDLLNPARKFVAQKDLIINFQPLRDYLNDKYEADPNVSIYFEYLPTGANISLNKDAEFWPASLLKVPVAMAVTKKIEKGEWKWTNELVLMASDKNERFGDLYKKPVGTQITIEEVIRRALVDSDNTANFMLVRNIEPAEFQNIYDHLGLTYFMSSEGKISAKKYSVMFRALYNASYLSEENSQKLLALMTETPFKEYIGGGLSESIKFSHKIGISDDKKVFLDSGIVYLPNRPYILTAMMNTEDVAFAQNQMKEISEKAYNYVLTYKD